MPALYPQQVDLRKTTIGGLLKNPRHVNGWGMADTPYQDIGERLAKLRTAFSEDTQKQWAERHGFNQTQYNNWEKGTRRITVDCAERLSDKYGLTLDYLYRGRLEGLSENARKRL